MHTIRRTSKVHNFNLNIYTYGWRKVLNFTDIFYNIQYTRYFVVSIIIISSIITTVRSYSGFLRSICFHLFENVIFTYCVCLNRVVKIKGTKLEPY